MVNVLMSGFEASMCMVSQRLLLGGLRPSLEPFVWTLSAFKIPIKAALYKLFLQMRHDFLMHTYYIIFMNPTRHSYESREEPTANGQRLLQSNVSKDITCIYLA